MDDVLDKAYVLQLLKKFTNIWCKDNRCEICTFRVKNTCMVLKFLEHDNGDNVYIDQCLRKKGYEYCRNCYKKQQDKECLFYLLGGYYFSSCPGWKKREG
ncbi:MAG: hypothetical protein MJZ37_08000 [Bacilli bacterium]|nr:hypothetical protein [Bacilli bacterium]